MTISDEIVISAQDLVKRFKTKRGTTTAVQGVSLQVRRGETFGLIGPDGAGKTTTVRVILGLLQRTAGESSILGFDFCLIGIKQGLPEYLIRAVSKKHYRANLLSGAY